MNPRYVSINNGKADILFYKNYIVTQDLTLLCLCEHKLKILQTLPHGKYAVLTTPVNVRHSKKVQNPNHSMYTKYVFTEQMYKVTGLRKGTRIELIKKLWKFIKDNGLQDAKNRRLLNVGDHEATKAMFNAKQLSMWDMTKTVSNLLKKCAVIK